MALDRLVAATTAALLVAGCGAGKSKKPKNPGNLITSDGAEYLAHEVIIKRQPGVDDAALMKAIGSLGGKMDAAGNAQLAAELGYVRVMLPKSVTADEAIIRLMEKGVAARVERNYVVEAFGTPNDPRYGELWGMAKIGAPAAWNVSTGSPNVVVAVSDTGVDYTHPDLAANMWKNTGEIAGNGKDDDGNGYVDDVYGYDFANNDGDPRDDNGHGTHCSGTIGAVGNDGVGVAGVNWRVKIMGVKFLNASGSGDLYNGVLTVLYAAKMKARVVSASWGCQSTSCFSQFMVDALNELQKQGGIFIAAAGNANNNNDNYPTYPANYANANVVAVAATDSSDNKASFSSYGPTKVHIAAPGVGILSTTPNNGYASWNGTSMATPHVAGAAALLLSMRPDMGPLEVRDRLLQTVDVLPSLSTVCSSKGRLNIQKLMNLDTTPPAAPTDVKAVPGDRGDVTVSWAPNGEADLAGYRVVAVAAPDTQLGTTDLAKDVTSHRFTGLVANKVHTFHVTARDTGANESARVTVNATPIDGMAPPQVVDLAATAIPGAPVLGMVSDASGQFSDYFSAQKGADGSVDTAWISPAREVAQEDHLVYRLNIPYFVDRVELMPVAAYPEFFPIDFDVDVSPDGTTWETVAAMRGATAHANELVTVAFKPTWATLVRLRVVRAFQHESAMFYTGIAELTVREISKSPDGLRLTFTAPGDDPGEGAATSYDIRASTSPMDESNFSAGMQLAAPKPAVAGTIEVIQAKELSGDTKYWIAMKAIDDAGHVSPMSNVAVAATLGAPPSTITDLRQTASGSDWVTLSWTAPGEDGTIGTAASYDLRVSTVPLSPANFSTATPVAGVPAPQTAGMAESFSVTGLDPKKVYYFALRAIDRAGSAGFPSNVVSAQPDGGPDETPPATVIDLTAVPSSAARKLSPKLDSYSSSYDTNSLKAENLLDGNLTTFWLTSYTPGGKPEWMVADLNAVETVSRVRLNPGTSSLMSYFFTEVEVQGSSDKSSWTTLAKMSGILPTWGKWIEIALTPTPMRFLRIYTTKLGAANYYVGAAELEVYALTPEMENDLTFVAPGDDGYVGTAARYEMRSSAAPIDASNFASATAVPTLAPLRGGMLEVVKLPALPVETTRYYAMRAHDEAGNVAGLSNVVKLETPSVVPSPVTDLAVSSTKSTTVSLEWTATGDDGMVGIATAYDLRYGKAPLSAINWDAATKVATGTPIAPSQRDRFTVTGLESSTRYYFGIKVIDDRGNESLLSNIASGETQDGTPPADITDLVAAPVDPQSTGPLALTVSSSSGAKSPETDANKVLDTNAETAWFTPSRPAFATEEVQLKLEARKRLRALRLRGATGYADRFPPGFDVEVRAVSGGAWTKVVSETDFVTSGAWEQWQLGGVEAVEARLVVTKTLAWAGLYYAVIGDLELLEESGNYTRVRLSWTAPGDDADRGTATRYDVRQAATAITNASFGGATVVPGAPTPHAAGTVERLEVGGLQPDTTYCFAVIAIDDVSLAGKVASSPCVKTAGLPPSAVVDLRGGNATASTVDLSWTAPGADGTAGTAASYELRWALARINDDTWANATVVNGLPAPRAAGTAETFKVTGLAQQTVYHFALKATDDRGNVSPLSNVATAKTADGVAPGDIVDLVATAVDPQEVTPAALTVLASSGSQSAQTDAKSMLDSNQGTAWFSPARPTFVADTVTLKADAKKRLGALRMRGATGYADRFPRGFDVEVRASATAAWTKVVTETDFVTTGAWEEWKLGAVEGLEVRLTMTKLSTWAGLYYGVIGDLELIEDSGNFTRVRLSWTAPGDDNDIGTATRYDVRQAAAPITGTTFSAATPIAAAPKPGVAGTVERLEVSGLQPETKYCFAAIAYDDVELASKVAGSPCVTTPGLPPSTIVDLRSTAAAATTVDLAWTAPGADGTVGTAARYELRYALARINASNWDQATAASGLPAPRAAGTAETFKVTGLKGLTTYFFAVRAVDGGNNAGAISNIATVKTADDVPPATVTDLRVTSTTTTSVFLAWTAPGDNGPVGTAAKYDLRVSTAPITDGNFASATAIVTSAPTAGGTATLFEAKALASEATYHFALKTTDTAGNVSALSNVVSGATKDVPPAQVTNLAVASSSGGAQASVVIQWTAPGDDGAAGTATRYDIRYLQGTLSGSNFATGTAATAPAPAVAGTVQQATIGGLTPGKSYQIGLVAYDERNNASPLSNVVTTVAADDLAPAAVTNLSATKGTTNGTMVLTWTAPGDDGTSGSASGYDLRWSRNAITAANFAAATALTAPNPVTGGSQQTYTASGLPDETQLYFALRAKDDVPNWSALSNVASAMTADVAPAAVTTLKQTARTATSITVIWTATGDDGNTGTATAYDVRYSTAAITPANFDGATVAAMTAPQASGATETLTIGGLSGSAIYHVALKVRDDRGNVSGLSNVLGTETTDTAAPAKITTLAAATGTAAGSVVLTWIATGDNGTEGRATSYEVRRSTAAITDANWAQATVLTGAPTPKDPGAAETFTVTGLAGETTHHFAVRSVDEASNASPVSNSAAATTAPVAPGAIADLAAVASPSTVTLTWTAPGDDGSTGTAKLYDVRYAKTAITDTTFAAATAAAGAPAPAAAGTKQTFAIGALAESTTYHFAIKTQDDTGAWSAISNIPTAKTPDLTAPAAPSSLGAAPGDVGGAKLKVASAKASTTLGGSWSASNAIDDSPTTSWASAPRATDGLESLTVDLGASKKIDRVRLLPDTFYPQLFPRDFTVEVSADEKAWTTLVVEEEFSTSNVEWLSWGFPAVDARYVRLSSTETQVSHGLHYAIVADVEVYGAAATDGRATLTWIAPGDDGKTGTATSYQVYRHTAAFTETTLSSATLVPQTVAPLPAGALQSLTVSGLAGETTYFWAVRAIDDGGNVGPLSNVASGKTNAVAPAAVQDLAALALGTTSIEVSWTAPGDDAATGKATSYEMRYAAFALTSQNFPLGTQVNGVPAPATAGAVQKVTVGGLTAGKVYRFALLARDEEGNASYLSNVAMAVTQAAPDTTAPGAVTNLAARLPSAGGQVITAAVSGFSSEQAPDFKASAVADGRRDTFWASAARAASQEEYVRTDLKALTSVDKVRIWPSATQAALFPPSFEVRVSPDGLAWTTVHTAANYVASPNVAVVAAFTARSIRYVELRATALASHANGLFYAVVAEVEALTSSEAPGTALLSFTSPTDDGATGRAASYDLRVGPCPFAKGTSTAVPTTAPLAAGNPELYKVTGLAAGTYCAAVTSTDAAGNTSATSNVAQFTVP